MLLYFLVKRQEEICIYTRVDVPLIRIVENWQRFEKKVQFFCSDLIIFDLTPLLLRRKWTTRKKKLSVMKLWFLKKSSETPNRIDFFHDTLLPDRQKIDTTALVRERNPPPHWPELLPDFPCRKIFELSAGKIRCDSGWVTWPELDSMIGGSTSADSR